MSYILDALRRADAERERGRGAVPGLHSANLAPAAGDAPLTPPPAAGRGLALAVVALGLLALLAAVWWLGRASAPAPQGAVPAPPAPAVSAAPPAPVPVLSSPTVVVAPPPAPAAPRADAATSGGAAPASTDASAAAVAASPVPPPRPAAAPEPSRPVPLARLTPEQRQAFPALSLGGSVWSDSPGNRFVIANGQVVREGEGAAPGVTVERIEPRAVIVRWRDLRVELPL